MNKKGFTARILSRGWSVKGALEHWGRTYQWYHAQCNGDDKAKVRLICMIDGLEKVE